MTALLPEFKSIVYKLLFPFKTAGTDHSVRQMFVPAAKPKTKGC